MYTAIFYQPFYLLDVNNLYIII